MQEVRTQKQRPPHCRSNDPQEFRKYLRSSESRSELVSNWPEPATAMNAVNGNWPIIIGSEAANYFCIEGVSLRNFQSAFARDTLAGKWASFGDGNAHGFSTLELNRRIRRQNP
jgi:hypothetical protein